MTKEWITQFNKKCAEFLGLKRGWWTSQEKPLIDEKKQWWDIDGKTILGTKVYYDKDLQFHSDWNWIMEVVEKIRKVGWRFDTSHSGSVSSKEINVFIWRKYPGGGETDLIQISNEDSKIVTIQAIEKFIDWYNKQKKI